MTGFEGMCLVGAMVAAVVGLIASPHTYKMPMTQAMFILCGPSAVLVCAALTSLAARAIN